MEDYHAFRRRTMEELTVEFPEKSYREKQKIVSSRWKQTKITQLVRLSEEELVNAPLNDAFFRKLRYTIIDTGVEEFLGMEYGGDNTCLRLLSKCMRTLPPKSRHMAVFSRFITSKSFYRKVYGGVDVIDLCCIETRRDFLYEIFTKMPPRWLDEVVLSKPDRLGIVMNVFLLNIFDEDLKHDTLEMVRKLILRGLDPNLEICYTPGNKWNIPQLYKDSLYKYITENGCWSNSRRVVRYVGCTDPCSGYRDFLVNSPYFTDHNGWDNISAGTAAMGLKFLGDTVLSILLQNSRNRKLRDFVAKIFKTGVANGYTLLSPYKYRTEMGTATYFSLSLMSGSMKHIDELSSIIFHMTPSFLFFINDVSPLKREATNPIHIMYKSIKTPWLGYISTCPDSSKIVNKIVENGFIIPSREVVWKFHMQRDLVETLDRGYREIFFSDPNSPTYMNIIRHCNKHNIPVSETCLSAILLSRDILNVTMKRGLLPNAYDNLPHVILVLDTERDKWIEKVKTLCRPTPPPGICSEFLPGNYMNDFFLNGDSVEETGKYVFVTNDNYAFEPSEWPFLLQRKQNPYTRRGLTVEEVSRLRTLRDIINNYWYLFSADLIPSTNT